jgi:hypothetical protein
MLTFMLLLLLVVEYLVPVLGVADREEGEHVRRGSGFLVALLEMSLQGCVRRAVASVCTMVMSSWLVVECWRGGRGCWGPAVQRVGRD